MGYILNIGSVAGFVGAPGWSIYSATKAGVAAFTEVLALDAGRIMSLAGAIGTVRVIGCAGCNGGTGLVVIAGMKRASSILICFLALLGQSCSKHHDNDPFPGSATVYVAGDDGVNPVLWIDGKAQTLATDGGFASQVLLAGSEVYVAGVSDQGTNPSLTPAGPYGQYGYWKNGAETRVGTPKFLMSPIAIAVNGNDVYFSNGPLYKNGSSVSLAGLGEQGFVCSAMTVAGDVYLAGRDSTGNGVYWKNGVLHLVAATQPIGPAIQIYCMYVSNGDVYVGGSDLQDRGAIWINGLEHQMPWPLWDVVCIFVDGSDVYSISHVVVNNFNIPAYWKNGVQVNLPLNGAAYGNATSIFVSGGDVYVTGVTSHGAVLWKNGVEKVLSSRGEAFSVAVR